MYISTFYNRTEEVSEEMEDGRSWILPSLKDYCAASNLAFNEHIQDLKLAGEKIHHLAFGQSPFPVYPKACQALAKHVGENAYLPISGKLSDVFSGVGYFVSCN